MAGENAKMRDHATVEKAEPGPRTAPHWRKVEQLTAQIVPLIAAMKAELEAIDQIEPLPAAVPACGAVHEMPELFSVGFADACREKSREHTVIGRVWSHVLGAIMAMEPTEAMAQTAVRMLIATRRDGLQELVRGRLLLQGRADGIDALFTGGVQGLDEWLGGWSLPALAMQLFGMTAHVIDRGVPESVGRPAVVKDHPQANAMWRDNCIAAGELFNTILLESETARELALAARSLLEQTGDEVAAAKCRCTYGVRCAPCEAKTVKEGNHQAIAMQVVGDKLFSTLGRLAEWGIDMTECGMRLPVAMDVENGLLPASAFQPVMGEEEYRRRLNAFLNRQAGDCCSDREEAGE